MGQPAPFVDSHIHFWDPTVLDYPWLADDPVLGRPFLPGDLDVTGLELDGFVFVQAACRPEQAAREVAWVRELARAGTPIVGIVAHADLELGAECAGKLGDLAADGLVVGIRRLIQDEPPGFAVEPDFVTGVGMLAEHRLTFDLCVRHGQLAEVAQLVEQCADVTFVLDHLGKPDVAGGNRHPWTADLAGLARYPNVSCKLSGLSSEADEATRNLIGIRPYLQHAVDVFGPSRCLFGSDWPVVSTTMTYQAWLELVTDACSDLGSADLAQIMGGTARRVYGRQGHSGDNSRSWIERSPSVASMDAGNLERRAAGNLGPPRHDPQCSEGISQWL